MDEVYHRLTNKDEETRTAVCSVCGPVKMSNAGYGRNKQRKWRCRNSGADQRRRANRNARRSSGYRPWREYVSDVCVKCGFEPVHPCQLDVDHVDGDKSNNDPSNLQTLCANCHRLKTYLNAENLPFEMRRQV